MVNKTVPTHSAALFVQSSLQIVLGLIVLLVVVGCDSDNDQIAIAAPPADQPAQPEPEPVVTPTQYLYTQTNDPRGNHVVLFTVSEQGTLSEQDSFETGGYGDADDNDFDSQGAVRILDNYLLTVNSGEEPSDTALTSAYSSVAVFEIAEDGTLSRIDQDPDQAGIQNVDSRGIRAVSIDFFNTDDTTWVVVANQHSNRLCLTIESDDLAECVDQYGNTVADLLESEDTTGRNLQLFRFENGRLNHVRELVAFTPRHGGPSQVTFSPDGRSIVTTLWGIPNILYPADPTLLTPSRTMLWSFDSTVGESSVERYFEHPGISGSVGFGWRPDSRFVYVSSFSLDASAADASVVALDTQSSDAVFTSDGNSVWSGAGAIPVSERPAACWLWVNEAGDRVYTIAFRTNTVSTFETDGPGLDHLQTLARQGIDVGDSKDLFISADGKWAWVLGAYETHTISTFSVEEDGSLLELSDSPLEIQAARPEGENLSPLLQAYQGLAGYPAGYVGY